MKLWKFIIFGLIVSIVGSLAVWFAAHDVIATLLNFGTMVLVMGVYSYLASREGQEK